jgi:hypothetical protein
MYGDIQISKDVVHGQGLKALTPWCLCLCVALTFLVCAPCVAGHLVPQTQPERALDMITRFISGKPFGLDG